MTAGRIMIVGDDPSTTEAVEQLLARLGHTVCATARSEHQAIEQAGEIGPDLLLIDLDGDASGIEGRGTVQESI